MPDDALIDTRDETGLRLMVVYDPEAHDFVVSVTHDDGRHLVERVSATYRPVFGIDVADHAECMAAAERMAERMDRGEG